MRVVCEESKSLVVMRLGLCDGCHELTDCPPCICFVRVERFSGSDFKIPVLIVMKLNGDVSPFVEADDLQIILMMEICVSVGDLLGDFVGVGLDFVPCHCEPLSSLPTYKNIIYLKTVLGKRKNKKNFLKKCLTFIFARNKIVRPHSAKVFALAG